MCMGECDCSAKCCEGAGKCYINAKQNLPVAPVFSIIRSWCYHCPSSGYCVLQVSLSDLCSHTSALSRSIVKYHRPRPVGVCQSTAANMKHWLCFDNTQRRWSYHWLCEQLFLFCPPGGGMAQTLSPSVSSKGLLLPNGADVCSLCLERSRWEVMNPGQQVIHEQHLL